MILPDNIAETGITLKDQYFDLKGLSAYSALGVSTLRDYIRAGKLPAFKVKGKVLIRKSEFDKWMEAQRINRKAGIARIADEALKSLKRN
ncbi:MAG: helix-turn-helix domain-containing protein [Deltaproteobacteria bacterium]|nr:helix-turn-helix domain-containing protein [Deltaproteobacteria bacterium]MBW2309805.1 helix-turn-helix domain-containing protein [Deltaproteobacteria bacterium]